MIRHAFTVPGNDCIYGACRAPGCPGELGMQHPRNHGITGEHWLYIVRRGGPYATLADGAGPALSLEVYTDILPETVPADHEARCGVWCHLCGHAEHRSSKCENHLRPRRSYPGLVNEICDCPARPLADRRRGADMSLHSLVELAWEPTSILTMGARSEPDAIVHRDGCLCLGGRPCWVKDTTALGADEFFRKHGDPSGSSQDEAFWRALEEKLEEWTK